MNPGDAFGDSDDANDKDGNNNDDTAIRSIANTSALLVLKFII